MVRCTVVLKTRCGRLTFVKDLDEERRGGESINTVDGIHLDLGPKSKYIHWETTACKIVFSVLSLFHIPFVSFLSHVTLSVLPLCLLLLLSDFSSLVPSLISPPLSFSHSFSSPLLPLFSLLFLRRCGKIFHLNFYILVLIGKGPSSMTERSVGCLRFISVTEVFRVSIWTCSAPWQTVCLRFFPKRNSQQWCAIWRI